MKFFGTDFNKFNKVSGIYVISYKNKDYIGSAINIKKRLRRHRRELCDGKHCNDLLQRHFNKYGSLDWKFKVIYTFDEKLSEDDINMLRKVEFKFINKFNPFFNFKLSLKDSLYNNKKKKRAYNAITVHQYDLNGNYIRSYPSAMSAAKDNNCSHSGISACVRKQKGVYTCGKYRWSDKRYKTLPKNQKQYSFDPRPLIMYDNNKTKEFSSITEASKYLCGSNKLLQRIRYAALKDKVVKGYKFSFV